MLAMHRTKILSVGYDDVLLSTRTALLEREGYSVTSANTFREGLQRLKIHPYDLVILCHGIARKDRDEFARIVKLTHANAAVLMLELTNFEARQWADAVASSASPEEFLSSVSNLLSSRESHPFL